MKDIEKRSGGKLHHRQKILRDFFVEVLGINQRAAEEGAGRMEHAVSLNIVERMAQYACYLKEKTIKQKFDRNGDR